jgi:inner membrane protein
MTGRTHDLIAFTALTAVVVYTTTTPPHISLATLVVSFTANQIGGLFPDIDQPTAHLWHKIPVGSIIGRIISPLFGGHRFISHSIIGIILTGILLRIVLAQINTVLLVDMNVVWLAFMIGYISHLIADTFTIEGVPWLFPMGIKFGVPPFKEFRIKTGGLREKYMIFPGFVLLNFYIFATHYNYFLTFLHSYIKK